MAAAGAAIAVTAVVRHKPATILLATTTERDLFGAIEFAVRDHVHAIKPVDRDQQWRVGDRRLAAGAFSAG